jgi:hypothetical protein
MLEPAHNMSITKMNDHLEGMLAQIGQIRSAVMRLWRLTLLVLAGCATAPRFAPPPGGELHSTATPMSVGGTPSIFPDRAHSYRDAMRTQDLTARRALPARLGCVRPRRRRVGAME